MDADKDIDNEINTLFLDSIEFEYLTPVPDDEWKLIHGHKYDLTRQIHVYPLIDQIKIHAKYHMDSKLFIPPHTRSDRNLQLIKYHQLVLNNLENFEEALLTFKAQHVKVITTKNPHYINIFKMFQYFDDVLDVHFSV